MRFMTIVNPATARPIMQHLTPNAANMRTLLSDRVANGCAFPGEHVVRYPRRLARLLRLYGRNSLYTLRTGTARAWLRGFAFDS